MSKSKSYKVGYGRPPESTRFKKGQSGNKRRASGVRNRGFAALIDRMLERKIQFTFDGKRKQLTMNQVIVKQQVVAAAQGDMGALDLLLMLKSYAQKQRKWPSVVIDFESRGY